MNRSVHVLRGSLKAGVLLFASLLLSCRGPQGPAAHEALAVPSAGAAARVHAAQVIEQAVRCGHEHSDAPQILRLDVNPVRITYLAMQWKEGGQGWNPERSIKVDIPWREVLSVDCRYDGKRSLELVSFRFETDRGTRAFHFGDLSRCPIRPRSVFKAIQALAPQAPVSDECIESR